MSRLTLDREPGGGMKITLARAGWSTLTKKTEQSNEIRTFAGAVWRALTSERWTVGKALVLQWTNKG